ncbi:protein transport Sec1a [Lactuca sativa]|uniref:protein transport Sec1a n=1 Tax=Lactuca sativa TaxID=4236 RepID=UPI0022AF6968|nr:protein transport Sec1a [Lactuca sativa]
MVLSSCCRAFVYFSSPIPKDFIGRIKADTTVIPRIGGLSEMNLEYFPIENQVFVTDHERALEELYGDDADTTPEYDVCLREMAIRVATVFASLKEFPNVRYRVKPTDGSVETTFRELVPKKLALAIWEYIKSYQHTIPNFPQSETCELLIVDRSVDLVAPVIHEWTYDAMCHDLVDLDGNKYTMEVPNKSGGAPERKDFLLEDHDPVWLEMRHLHIADASERLSDKMDTLMSTNKVAQLQQKDKSELSTRDIQQMVQAMPAFNEQKEKLSLHVEIAGKINKVIAEEGLRDLGQIEQDLVFGDAGNKELLEFLEEYEDHNVENRLRLMMIYALADPEKFEGDQGAKLMELADLTPQSMIFINNMRLLEGPPKPKKPEPSGGFLKGKKKATTALRKDKQGEEETWALFRFFPVLEELLEKIDKNEMPKDEYECINESESSSSGRPAGPGGRTGRGGGQIRSRRKAAQTKSDDGHSSDSVVKNATVDLKHLGQRIFVFIIGGATRSELRICHKLTAKLKREIVLGSTSIDDPPNYITKVKMLSFSGYGC